MFYLSRASAWWDYSKSNSYQTRFIFFPGLPWAQTLFPESLKFLPSASDIFPQFIYFLPKGSGYIPSPLIFLHRSFKPIYHSHNPPIHPWTSNILPLPQIFFLPWVLNILPWVSDRLPQAYNILICFPSRAMHLWTTGKELNDDAIT